MADRNELADVLGYSDPATLARNYTPALRDPLNYLGDNKALSAAQKAAVGTTLATAFSDARIAPEDQAERFANIILRGMVKPPSVEEREQWTVANRKQLRERYPDEKNAEHFGRLVDQFIDARPEFAKLVDGAGVRHHPALREHLLTEAHSLPPAKRGSR